MEIIADKVTFLSSSRKDKNEDVVDIPDDTDDNDGNDGSDDVPIDVVKESEKKYKKKKK